MNMVRSQLDRNRDKPAMMLVPFAVLHSQLFWFCSVVWTICTRLSTETVNDHSAVNNDAATSPRTRTVVQRRPRGFSEPPTPKPSIHEPPSRPRSTTISAGASLPSTGRCQRLLRTLHVHLDADNLPPLRPTAIDERQGLTCPPQWWQKTRFILDTLKHQSPTTPSPSPSASATTNKYRDSNPCTSSHPVTVLTPEDIHQRPDTISLSAEQIAKPIDSMPHPREKRRSRLSKIFSRQGDQKKEKPSSPFTSLKRSSWSLLRKKKVSTTVCI